MEITHINQLDPLGTYTYADYLLWKLKEKIQLFRGKIFAMSPAPARFHQEISTNLNELLIPFLRDKNARFIPLLLMSSSKVQTVRSRLCSLIFV